MATIGLDKLYYARVTENPDTGEETYATPTPLVKPSPLLRMAGLRWRFDLKGDSIMFSTPVDCWRIETGCTQPCVNGLSTP